RHSAKGASSSPNATAGSSPIGCCPVRMSKRRRVKSTTSTSDVVDSRSRSKPQRRITRRQAMSQTETESDLATIDDAVQNFATSGYGIVRNLFSPDEIDTLDVEARQLLKRADLINTNNLRCRWQTDVETDACVFDAFDPVIDLSPVS